MKKLYLLISLIFILSLTSCKHINVLENNAINESMHQTIEKYPTKVKNFNVINKQSPELEDISINYINQEYKTYSLSVKYPSTVFNTINESIEDFVYPYINSYKDIIDSENVEISNYTLNIDFKLKKDTDFIIQFIFDIYKIINDEEQYFTKTFIADLEKGKIISKEDETKPSEIQTEKINQTPDTKAETTQTSSTTPETQSSVSNISKEEMTIENTNNEKLIALTFDDGPNPITTPILLDGLAQRNIKATFFMLGICIENNQDIVKRIYEEGHGIGNHSYGHENLIKLEYDSAKREYDKPNEILKSIIGTGSTLFRPPYGNYNDSTNKFVTTPIILWNIDPSDWKHKDANQIANHIISKAKDGDIILLHDIYKTSVQAAFKVIDTLQKDGFKFVTVDQLIRRNGDEPATQEIFRFKR